MKRLLLAFLAATAAPAVGQQPPAPTADYRARLPQDEIIYLVMPDRFDNADPSNDRGGLKGDRLKTGYDPTDKGFYHGGDLKGLIRRFDYIQGLGATAVWFTPVFKNKPVQGAPGQESAGYHGYWITDFTTIDPHLGTEAEFRAFVDAAHARGLKVYMDIVTNHTADVIHYAECARDCPYRSVGDYPRKAYTPIVDPADRHVKKPEWLNDPAYYHNRGNSTFRGESAQLGDFVGLDDLATEDPRVVQGFVDIFGSWIDRFGVDGFRIDTAKHVNPEFWATFVPAMEARARARGMPNFHIFGEVMNEDRNVALQAWWNQRGNMPSVLDFAVGRAIIDTAAGNAPADTFTEVFRGDDLYRGGAETAGQNPIFSGNYDIGRFGYFLDQKQPKASDEERLQRTALATAMVMTMRGVPVIYMGDEQGFTGHGNDQAARQDMFASKVASYNDNRLIGTTSTTAVSNFNPGHPLYREIAALAAVRRDSPALRRGIQRTVHDDDKPGVYAAIRQDPQSGERVLIAFNTAAAATTTNIAIDRDVTSLKTLAGPCATAPREAGSVALTLPAFGYAVCQLEPGRR